MVAPAMTVTRRKGKYPPELRDITRLRIGFPKSQSSQSNIKKALWNEFGTNRIPARPFLRTSMRNNRKKYLNIVQKKTNDVLAGRLNIRQLLNQIGILAQGDVQDSIVSGNWVRNAPSTIKQKGSSRPLIDTGAMRQAVTWAIE